MTRLMLGVMGHVDHGKTALVRALTGIDTDRLPEEKRRGVSIVLGFAHFEVAGATVDLIDMPGHERFVRTMVSGATGVSAALLVVAANEGIKPQTLEHLQVAALLGLQRVVVVVSKIDLVADAQANAVGRDAAALVSRCGLSGAAPVLTSVRTGFGLDALCDSIATLAQDVQPCADDGFPYLPIDRAFSLPGHGTIVTGTLQRGVLSADQLLTTVPAGSSVRVRGIQVHGAAVQRAEPGQRVAVNLRGVEPRDVRPGSALSQARRLTPSTWLDVSLRSTPDAPPLKTGMRLSLLFATVEVQVQLRLLDGDVLAPGAEALAQLHCTEPTATLARMRFILRVPSPAMTLAGGVVLDPGAVRRRRGDAPTLARLQTLATAEPGEILADTLMRAGMDGVGVDRLSQLVGWSSERVTAELAMQGALAVGGDIVVGQAAFVAAQRTAFQCLTDAAEVQPNGVSLRRLGVLAPLVSQPVLTAAVAMLVSEGKLSQENGRIRPPRGASDEAVRVRQATLAAEKLADVLRRGGLSPPDLDVIATTSQTRQALHRLVCEGVAVKTFDRVQKREVVFHREAVEAAQRRLASKLAPPGLLLKEAGAVLGVSRKYSVPLLEYLDTVRFTRRVGDRRVLGPSGQV